MRFFLVKLFGLNSEKHFISFKVYDEKRKLITGGLVKNKYPSKMIIHCKDLRVFQFCLTYTKEEDAKKVIFLTRGLKCICALYRGFHISLCVCLFVLSDLSGYCSPLFGGEISEVCLCLFLYGDTKPRYRFIFLQRLSLMMLLFSFTC